MPLTRLGKPLLPNHPRKEKKYIDIPSTPPFDKGRGLVADKVCSERAANKLLTLLEKKEKEIMTV